MTTQHLAQKINYLKWLDAIGVKYYCSEVERSIKMKKITTLTKTLAKTLPETLVAKAKAQEKVQKNYKQQSLIEVEAKIITDQAILPIKSSEKTSPQSNNSLIDDLTNIPRALADKASSLAELKEIVENFTGCDLKKLATNTVFSDGNPKGPLMFIGEAPGNSEDLAGIPFCGESGKLLDHMLSSIGISRQDNAYITNTVFWRPPANRTPTQEEVDICRPFVEKHIALINPQLIVLVGNVAATSLLGKNAGISKIRQEYYSYTNRYLTKPIPTTAIFHPAYLLRQPMQKKTTWYDLLKIQEFVKGHLLLEPSS